MSGRLPRLALPVSLVLVLAGCADSLQLTDPTPQPTPEPLCEPGAVECTEDGVRVCQADGQDWTEKPCDEDEFCVEGVCLAQNCEPGERACAADAVLICDDQGLSWLREPCDADEVCFGGVCLECVRDEDCGDSGLVCDDGTCVEEPLVIVTTSLPFGELDRPYEVTLDADGGVPPYDWSVIAGDLPAGLELSGRGVIEGVPEEPGTFDFTVLAQDDSSEDQQRYSLTVYGSDGEIEIITDSDLGFFEEGSPVGVEFDAIGGEPPYGWFAVDGAWPAGLSLNSLGVLEGTPSEVGPFDFTLRVVDSATPPAFAEKDFFLDIEVAPLEIVAEQMFDLFVVQVVVLPLITVVEGIPVPYSQDLNAVGGLRPYTWTEQPLPGGLESLIPLAGIPDGLELSESGTLSGAVTDTSQVFELSIPFTGITLTGFFFTAQVADSQDPAETESAVFLLPTIPIGGSIGPVASP